MKFLVRKQGNKKAAHYWNGSDTACRMWSTGGIDKRRAYEESDTNRGMKICHMCQQVAKRDALLTDPEASHEPQRQVV